MTLHITFRSLIATSTPFRSGHDPRGDAAPAVPLRAMLRKSVDLKPIR